MKLSLTVYTDDSLTDVKRVVEAERLKIPYRVTTYIAQFLDTADLDSEDDIYKFIIGSMDKLDKIIRATFGLSESELECVDTSELVETGVALYKWGVDKINSLKGNNEKNA